MKPKKISKTKINKRSRKKTNPKLAETIFAAKKNASWLEVAKIISSSTRNAGSVNLDKINATSKQGDIIAVPGKVLGKGEVSKKLRVCALSDLLAYSIRP